TRCAATKPRPDLVPREGGRPLLRRAHVGKLRELELGVERVAALEPVEHRGHEPREVLRAPDAAYRVGRVALEQRAVAVAVPGDKRRSQEADVGNRKVKALGARRRKDWRRVAGG